MHTVPIALFYRQASQRNLINATTPEFYSHVHKNFFTPPTRAGKVNGVDTAVALPTVGNLDTALTSAL